MKAKNNHHSISGSNSSSIHKLTLWSIAIFIFSVAVFELNSSLSRFESIALYLCLALCLIDILSKKLIRLNRFHLTLILFGIVLLVSSFFSPTNAAVKQMYLYRYVTTAIVVILISIVLEEKNDIRFLLNAYIFAGAATAVSVYMTFGLSGLASAASRFGTDIGNQNLVGMYCGVAVIIAIYNIIVYRRECSILYNIICAVVSLPVVMFSGSRKAILMIAVSIIVLILSYSDNKKKIKRIIGIIVTVVVLYYVITRIPAFGVISDRFASLFSFIKGGETELAGDIHRVTFIQEGWKHFLEHPIVGNGFCYSYYVFGTYSHSNYIELLMNNGLVGFCLYYLNHIRIVKLATGIKHDDKISFATVMMIVAMILVCDIGMVSYYNRFLLLLLTICNAILSGHKSENFYN